MKKVAYQTLNPKQQESYNYQKISALLAEYGYITYRMHDDYHGADFHAVNINGTVLKVQLKGRIAIDKKYLNKEIHILAAVGVRTVLLLASPPTGNVI